MNKTAQGFWSWTGPHEDLLLHDGSGEAGGGQIGGRVCLKGAAGTPVPLFPFAFYLSNPFSLLCWVLTF